MNFNAHYSGNIYRILNIQFKKTKDENEKLLNMNKYIMTYTNYFLKNISIYPYFNNIFQ